jgi:hypothetical protein
MRVVIIWRDDTDYARTVIDWLRDFEARTGKMPESLSPDEPEGESLCRAYYVVEYPTIMALDVDGSLLQMWRGTEMPRISDVSYYLMEH